MTKRFSSLGKALSTSSALNFQPISSKEVPLTTVVVVQVEAEELSVKVGGGPLVGKVVGVFAVLGHASVAKVLLFSGSNSLGTLEVKLRTEDQFIPRSTSVTWCSFKPSPESMSEPG